MNYIIRRHFLPPDVDASVRALARHEELYVPATVFGDADWRSGHTAAIEGRPEAHAVIEVVLKAVPAVCYALGIDAFAPSRCEVQLSCYGNGGHFRAHNDSGTMETSPETVTRVLSYVIYMDLVKPRPWSGGQLEIFPDVIPIEDGMAIFFPSEKLHAILPVTASWEWESGRHTVNGWVRK